VKLPSYLAVVLPLAILLSLLYALGTLHRNLEITALRAAGLGLGRITRSIWVVGVLLCVLMGMLNATIIPWSVEESRVVWSSLEHRAEVQRRTADRVGASTLVAFDNRAEQRLWFMNRYSRFTGRGYGVMVSELDEMRRETLRLTAREAEPDPAGLGWIFREGRETWLDPATGEVLRTRAFAERRAPHYTEDPDVMLVFDVKPDDLSFRELRRLLAHHRAEDNPKIAAYAVRYYGMLANTLGPLIIIAIAVPFAVAGVRVSPAVGVSKSLGLFLVYFILLKISTALGARGVVEPWLAALAPNLIMLGVGAVFFVRGR
jgi:lipopolysaccharide export system permease protein